MCLRCLPLHTRLINRCETPEPTTPWNHKESCPPTTNPTSQPPQHHTEPTNHLQLLRPLTIHGIACMHRITAAIIIQIPYPPPSVCLCRTKSTLMHRSLHRSSRVASASPWTCMHACMQVGGLFMCLTGRKEGMTALYERLTTTRGKYGSIADCQGGRQGESQDERQRSCETERASRFLFIQFGPFSSYKTVCPTRESIQSNGSSTVNQSITSPRPSGPAYP